MDWTEISPQQEAVIRAQAMNDLRDIFRRDGNELAAIVCSNLSAFTQADAGLATLDEIINRGSSDVTPREARNSPPTRRADTGMMLQLSGDILKAMREQQRMRYSVRMERARRLFPNGVPPEFNLNSPLLDDPSL